MSSKNTDLEERFNNSLEELFEVYQKTEPKQVLSYVEPMNLKHHVSNVDYASKPDTKSNINLKTNISKLEYSDKPTSKEISPIGPKSEELIDSYTTLKNEMKSLAQKINILNKFENMKNDYVRKRDAVMFFTGLADFEKLSREKEIRRPLEKVKLGIRKISLVIDKKMDDITERIDEFSKIRDNFEQKRHQISSDKIINTKNQNISNIDLRVLNDGIKLCDQIIFTAKKRVESLNRSMWMCMPISEKSVGEKMNIPKMTNNSKKDISMER